MNSAAMDAIEATTLSNTFGAKNNSHKAIDKVAPTSNKKSIKRPFLLRRTCSLYSARLTPQDGHFMVSIGRIFKPLFLTA